MYRITDAIYMEHMINKCEDHLLMNLNTREEVNWHGKITKITVTDVIIKAVEGMALHQIMKVIKIQNIEKVIYHPTDWVSGVEYSEDEYEPNNPNTPETDANNYKKFYDKDMDLDQEEK